MEWNDLHLFLAAARCGSVRQAAREARVDASTISRRLSALERGLGARLFERMPSGLVLTQAGQEMLDAVDRMEGIAQEIGRKISGRDRRMSGLVRVTMPRAFSRMISEVVARFSAAHPDVEVELQASDATLDLDGRDTDVALRIGDAPAPHLVGRRLARLAGGLYAARGYLATHRLPLESGSHLFVEWNRRYATKPALAWVAERYQDRKVVARGLSTQDVLEAIRAGVGIGALPCVLAAEEPTLERLALAPPETWAGVWLLVHRDVRPSTRVRALADRIAEAVRTRRALIEGR